MALAGAAHAVVNARLLRRPGRPGHAHVSVLVPARDEAAHIGDCVRSIVDQNVAEVLVLDDGSADDTAALAGAAGARVLTGAPPPEGWLGKPWACAQLAHAAAPASDVLVFVDADVRLTPGAIARAVGMLGDLDLVSPLPRQLAVSCAERLVQPLLAWSILTYLPLRLAERSPRPSLSAAVGQFVVVRRAAYDRAGGHVPADVLDDLALLRAVKRTDGRGAVVDGTALASCRMYNGWQGIRDGYGKSLWAAFGSPVGAAAVVGLQLLAYVLPPLAALRGSRAGAIGYAAGVAGRLIIARRTRSRLWPDALAHPLSVATFAALTVDSFREQRRGRLRWKGRPIG